MILLVSCQTATSEPDGLDSPATSANPPSTTTGSQADDWATELADLAFAYWEAFNAYEPDRVLSYLDKGYGTAREETIRSEIDQLSTFGVKLGVQEESPPVMLGDDTAEMFLELKNPLGVRRIRMAFERIDGEWAITFAEEVG
jgi:hypothetical protein